MGCEPSCGAFGPALLFVIPALLVVAGAWYLNGRRTRDLRALAASKGWAFDPSAAGLPDVFALGLPGLPRYAGPEFMNLVGAPAPAGCRAWFADTRVRLPRGGAPDSSFFTIALFELEGRDLPAFRLRPEVFTDSGDDINLEGYAKFSGAYHLRADDRAAAEKLFYALADLLGERPGWFLTGKGRYLLAYKADSEAPAAAYAEFTEASAALASAFRDRAPRA